MVVAVGTMAEAEQMMRKVMAEEQRKAGEVGEIATAEAEGQKMKIGRAHV